MAILDIENIEIIKEFFDFFRKFFVNVSYTTSFSDA